MSALGEKVQCSIGQLRAYPLSALVVSSTTVEHVLEIPIVGIYLVKYREYTCKYSILAPVEHVTGIGTYLIISRQQQRVQFELTVACTVIIELVFLCLHHITLGSNKLHIQHLAQCTWPVVGAERGICLEPHSLAQVVGCVVKVQEHTLLLHHAAHLYGSVGNAVDAALRHRCNATQCGDKICCNSF